MYNGHLNRIKPLTKPMLELLMECHERELMKLTPCEATDRGAKGLIARRLITTEFFKDENGKRYLGVYVTNEGRNYLRNLP